MKWYTYLICFILCVSGIFCGIGLYRIVKAESYTRGSIDIKNEFSMETFAYKNTSIELYHDLYDTTDTYSYQINLLKVTDFNGEKNNYNLEVNNYILLDTQITAGSIFSIMLLDFYNIEGDIVCSATLNISIIFLSDKTTLTLSTVGGEEAGYIEQYFADNGIRLKVNQIL